MTVRTALLLSFIAGALSGAAVMWLFANPSEPSGTELREAAGGVETTRPVRARSDPRSTGKRSENLDRPQSEPTRERDANAQSGDALEESRTEPRGPLRGGRRRARYRTIEFDEGALQQSGFSPDDVEWIRARWEQAESEKRYVAELEARDEDPPPGGGYSDIEREMREDLGDSGYDAMLYATNRDNRVVLERVRDDSVAYRAGLRDGSVVWSYDGQRVFHPNELATLSTTGEPGEPAEIAIVTPDGIERFFVERGPFGAELNSAKELPSPDSGP